ncbi:MAG: hypothetical protein WCH35_17920 [Comamonadaceae bacterium]
MSKQPNETSIRAPVGQLLAVLKTIALEAPDALDSTAALALQSQADGDLPLAAAAAGVVVLTEHLQAGLYKHAMRMIGVLAAVGPDAASGNDGLLAWAGAAVAHDYGVLPSWPAANLALLMERAMRAPTDFGLALACALGEVCERNGEDAEFAAIQAQVATLEVSPDASAFWQGHWSIVCAWHLCAFAKIDEARGRFEKAQALAATHGLTGLATHTALQRARLIEWRNDPAAALVLANQAVARGDPARTPLWFADLADVHCSAALRVSDFHAAVGHARRANGYLQLSSVWPGYQVTYRVNEAYALIGIGAADEAVARFRALSEMPLPRYLSARLRCLVDLAVLIAAQQRDPQAPLSKESLGSVILILRELEWPSVMHLLPQHIGQIFCQALVQGVECDWVCAAIRTRRLPAPAGAPENWPWQVRIRALGSFEVSTPNAPLLDRPGAARKAASKPLEVLRFLASYGHDMLPVDKVAAELWPGDGREGRTKALEVTVARLRKLLDSDLAVIVHDHRIGLNRKCVWVDVQTFSERLADSERAPEGSDSASRALAQALNLYRGPCLADGAQAWALASGERWRRRLAAALLRAHNGDDRIASRERELRLRGVAVDPLIANLLRQTK